jgi:hypothetical protein
LDHGLKPCLRYGVARLPDGCRKIDLADRIQLTIDEDFTGCILSFGERGGEGSGLAARGSRGPGYFLAGAANHSTGTLDEHPSKETGAARNKVSNAGASKPRQ